MGVASSCQLFSFVVWRRPTGDKIKFLFFFFSDSPFLLLPPRLLILSVLFPGWPGEGGGGGLTRNVDS